ncbi:kynurenine/alpha-aminoadipate aminotransferase, mitochondrial-like [Macrobrachium rosenbergii]|uniref:kynurenine/alpha-aminoadipate aminotransferase, mitochondrial-like n=1 Tax=Macrobrachium rosenbergii TaxID=79674 RepID=UPI0034D3C4EB
MDYSRFFSSVASGIDSPSIWNELGGIKVKEAPFEMMYGNPNRTTFPFLKAKVTLKNDQTFDINPEIMATLLQYHDVIGYQPLIQYIRVLTERLHDPPLWGDRKVVVTTGSLNALSTVFEMLLDAGDTVFVPMECYQGVSFAVS